MKIQYAPDNLPSRVIFEITQLCTYSCPECIARMHPPYLKGPSMEEIVLIGNKCTDAGVPSISWTGGEPYIRPEFLDALELIISHDKKRKVVQTVDTNGSLITPEIAERSSKLFNLARVSIYGTPITFYEETGLINDSKYVYEDSLNAIEYFIIAGLPLQINITVYSMDDLNFIIKTINTRWGDNKLLKEVVFIPRINAEKKLEENINHPSSEEIEKYIESYKADFKFNARLFKWKSGKHMVIKADCNVYAHPVLGQPGGLLFVGNALEESIESLWRKFPEEFIRDHRTLTPDVSHLGKK